MRADDASRTVADILADADANPRAVIGGNMPPEPTALDTARERLAELDAEAQNWFDGEALTSQAQADDVGKLLDAVRQARKDADAARAEEKRPHDDAAKAVQERWKPLLADADRIAEVAKAALTPWLQSLEREKRAREDAARRAAEEAAAEARRLAQASTGTLGEAKARDAAIEASEQAQRDLARAEKDKAGAKGGARSVSLRTSYEADLIDRRAYLNHVAKTRDADLTAWLEGHAQAAVRAGARDLPGVHVRTVQVAV